MTQKMSKIQIQYLENKLNKIGMKKTSDYNAKLPEAPSFRDKLEAIFKGKVKLIPYELYMKKRDGYSTHYLFDAYDMSKFDKISAEIMNKKLDFQNKVQSKIDSIMDSVILGGLDVEKAIKEFEAM